MAEARELAGAEQIDFDHHSAQFVEDPDHFIDQINAHNGVVRSNCYGGFHVFTRYRDVWDAAHDPQTFSSHFGASIPPVGQDAPFVPIEFDPPEHERYRRVLSPAFSQKEIASLETEIRGKARALAGPLIGQPQAELVAQFCVPLALETICSLLGISAGDRKQFGAWVFDVVHTSAHDPVAGAQAFQEVSAYLGAVIGEGGSGGGVLASLKTCPLEFSEKVSFACLLLLAGFDTTSSGLGAALLALRSEEQQRRLLSLSSTGAMESAVEELIRFVTPVVALTRTVTRPTVLGGVGLAEGDKVLLLLRGANRDEEQFDGAQELDLERQPNRHLAFGFGVHRCLGMHLARLEMRVGLEELLAAIAFEIDEESIEWQGGTVRGLRRLDARIRPRDGSDSQS